MLMDIEKTIKKYCGNIRERVEACRSKEVALALKERLCSELSHDCASEMVNNVLLLHVDKIIEQVFDENGKNIKLLEKNNETNPYLT